MDDFLPDNLIVNPVKPAKVNNDKNGLVGSKLITKPHGPNHKTAMAISLVRDKGMDPAKALMIANGTESASRHQISRLKQKVERWSIERPAAQKIAHSTLLRFASGRDVNGIEPKAVDVRASAERIIDQATPIIRKTENLNINAEICPVDLSRYLNG